jgi:hypothetical protein
MPLTLTVGYQQFSRNMRYRVVRLNHKANHKNTIEAWNFEIRKVVPEDQGLYECYIKIGPKHKLKANVHLNVFTEKGRHLLFLDRNFASLLIIFLLII